MLLYQKNVKQIWSKVCNSCQTTGKKINCTKLRLKQKSVRLQPSTLCGKASQLQNLAEFGRVVEWGAYLTKTCYSVFSPEIFLLQLCNLKLKQSRTKELATELTSYQNLRKGKQLTDVKLK